MNVKKALITSAAFMAVASATASYAEDVQVIQVNSGGSASGINRAPSNNSQLIITIQQLQDEMRQLRGMVESQQYTIDQLQAKQKERYRDLDRRISEVMRQQSGSLTDELALGALPLAPEPEASAPATEASNETPSTQLAPASSSQNNTSESSSSAGNDQDDYQAAFALVRQRSFSEAITQFDDFLTNYPQSPRIPNAHYWLGELYLATSDLDSAETEFQTVVKAYPDSRKASDALYKLGILFKQKGDTAQSVSFMERVVKEYPESSAARLAESALQ